VGDDGNVLRHFEVELEKIGVVRWRLSVAAQAAVLAGDECGRRSTTKST
jgi:hypothetical protein